MHYLCGWIRQATGAGLQSCGSASGYGVWPVSSAATFLRGHCTTAVPSLRSGDRRQEMKAPAADCEAGRYKNQMLPDVLLFQWLT